MKTWLSCFTTLFLLLNLLHGQTLNPNFPSVNGHVYAFAVKGDTLFIGGDFIEVGEIPRQNLAAIDLKTGNLLDWAPVADQKVDGITLDQNRVYVCGDFQEINQTPRNTLAALDANDATLTDWNPDIVFPGIPNMQLGRISGIAASEGIIYLTGYFLSINGTDRDYLAALDEEANLLAFHPAFDIPTEHVAIHNNHLYVSGPFTQVDGEERISFAAIDLNTWTLTDWNPQPNNQGNDKTVLFPDDENVFIAGFFTTIADSIRENAAKVDFETAGLLPWKVSFINAFPKVTSFASWGNQLFMGGLFNLEENVDLTNLVSVDYKTGEPTGWTGAPDDEVIALLVSQNKLVVGGKFTTISDQNQRGLAVYDLDAIISITELDDSEFSVFPVPATNQLTVRFPAEKVAALELYDLNGVLHERISTENTGQWTLELGNVAPGMYSLVFRTAQREIVKTELIPVVK